MTENEQIKAGYIRTYSGRKVYPFDLSEEHVCLDDITHALANICRYTGHVQLFYSVAQHSCLMAEFNTTPCDPRVLLLHDAAEAYLNDIASPVKHTLKAECESWTVAEAQAEEVIFKKYIPEWPDLRETTCGDYKPMDRLMLVTEMRQLITYGDKDWSASEPDLGIPIRPWTPHEAAVMFRTMLQESGIHD
jgi:hypothetical protein